MCVDGALIRYVGVSLSTVLTASKGNESELLTWISEDPGMDAS